MADGTLMVKSLVSALRITCKFVNILQLSKNLTHGTPSPPKEVTLAMPKHSYQIIHKYTMGTYHYFSGPIHDSRGMIAPVRLSLALLD